MEHWLSLTTSLFFGKTAKLCTDCIWQNHQKKKKNRNPFRKSELKIWIFLQTKSNARFLVDVSMWTRRMTVFFPFFFTSKGKLPNVLVLELVNGFIPILWQWFFFVVIVYRSLRFFLLLCTFSYFNFPEFWRYTANVVCHLSLYCFVVQCLNIDTELNFPRMHHIHIWVFRCTAVFIRNKNVCHWHLHLFSMYLRDRETDSILLHHFCDCCLCIAGSSEGKRENRRNREIQQMLRLRTVRKPIK